MRIVVAIPLVLFLPGCSVPQAALRRKRLVCRAQHRDHGNWRHRSQCERSARASRLGIVFWSYDHWSRAASAYPELTVIENVAERGLSGDPPCAAGSDGSARAVGAGRGCGDGASAL